MLSLAEFNLTSTAVARVAGRRIVVLTSGAAEPFIRRVSETLRGRAEVVRVVVSSDRDHGEDLSARLRPEALIADRIWGIVVTLGDQHYVPAALLVRCQLAGIRVMSEADFWERELTAIDIDEHDAGWLFSSHGFRWGRSQELSKRFLDLLIATTLMLLTLPLMAIVAVLIKLDSSGPVLYRQDRVGLGGRAFTLYKFRSMQQDAEKGGPPRWAALGDPRITRIGRFLRYMRIDELPQLFNVLRGEMSIVGPRPERPYFAEMLATAIPLYSVRHQVKPGITGWAQVNFTYSDSIEGSREKLRYDLYYLKHRSLLLDLLILAWTVRVVLRGEGAR